MTGQWTRPITLCGTDLNASTVLPNDATAGVDDGDYNVWRVHFGQTVGSGSLASGIVPEPSTLALLAAASTAIGLVAFPCRR